MYTILIYFKLTKELTKGFIMSTNKPLRLIFKIVLLARISPSGNAIPQAGDLIGETGIIEWQTLDKPVVIVINKQH